MTGTRQTTIHYRRLSADGWPEGESLHLAIAAAMRKHADGGPIGKNWQRRIWERDASRGSLFINHYAEQGDFLFGELMHFTPNHRAAVFRVAHELDEVPVRQILAPENMQFIHSLMFWLIRADHILLIQSPTLSSGHLEDYLRWLLQERTKVAAGRPIVLKAKFDSEAVGGDVEDISELTIGGAVSPASAGEPTAPAAELPVMGTETQQVKDAFADKSTLLRVLEALFSDRDRATAFISSLPAESGDHLRINVVVGYRTRKRDVRAETLKQLEIGLRNLPDAEIRVKSREGRQVGGEIRLQDVRSIKLVESLLDREDVYRAMLAAFEKFVGKGRITP